MAIRAEQAAYRRVSHGLGWPANAILFLPFVKFNQKLRNTSAPTASTIDEFRMLWLPWATHRKVWHKMEVWTATRAPNKLNLNPFYPIGRGSHDLVIVDDRQGKKNCFSRILLQKNMALAGHPDHAKLVYKGATHAFGQNISAKMLFTPLS